MTINHHTEIPDGANVDADVVNAPIGQIDSALTNALAGLLAFSKINIATGSGLTISSGAVTVTAGRHTVDTEGAASTDTLTDINGGSDGDILILSSASASRVVTLAHNAAKIYLAGEADIVLDSSHQTLILQKRASIWVHLQVPLPLPRARYAKLSHTETSGTAAGSPASALAWHTRTLNTEQDPDGLVTLSANAFTLAAGTYKINISVPAIDCNQHQARLYNVTDAAVEILGSSEFTSNADFVTTRSMVTGQITLNATKTLRVEHWVGAIASTYTWGYFVNTGNDEVYAVVEIEEVL